MEVPNIHVQDIKMQFTFLEKIVQIYLKTLLTSEITRGGFFFFLKHPVDIFLNQILLELIDYLFQFIQIKMLILKDLKLKNTTYQKA